MDISEAIASFSPITLHGVVVGQVSPLKSSKTKNRVRYFDGSFSDGKKTLRMISFDPKMRDGFEEAKKNQSSVALRNCIVKRGRSDKLEILLNGRSSMTRSPKKFKIPDEVNTISAQCPVVTTLEEVKDLAEHQKITITGKILSTSKPEQIVMQRNGTQLRKQDFAIADSTGALRGVAWESHVDVLNEDSPYKISCVTVRSFNGAKYTLSQTL